MEQTKRLATNANNEKENKIMETNKVQLNEMKAQDALLAETIIKNAPRIGGSKKIIADIPLTLMRIDGGEEGYQRDYKVGKLVMNWDDSKCSALVVSYRDGYFWIVDGQHRFMAAQRLNYSHLVCEVFLGLTREQEAEMFAKQNDNITRLTTYDTFKANLVYHEPIDTEIKRVCDDYGIAVKKSTAAKTLNSVSSARNIVKKDGSFTLKWIFSVIDDANWEDFKEPLSGDWLEGLYYVYLKNREHLTDIKKTLVNTLSHSNPIQIVAYGNATNPTLGRRMRLKVALDKIAKGECTIEDMNAVFA